MSTLFKVHEDEDCMKLLYLVRYLKAERDIDIRPTYIVERHFPEYIDGVVPSLMIENTIYKGLADIVSYLEDTLGFADLLVASQQFQDKNPEYRINDNSTHLLSTK